MTETTISVRIDKKVHNQMRLHDEINWSAVIRKSITKALEEFNKMDLLRAKAASKSIDKMRKLNAFSAGKSSVEVIREWRKKRR